MINLKELRTERNLTTQQMADFLGVSKGSYNYYELGKTEPSIDKIIKLADFFCVSTDYLLNANIYSTSGISSEDREILKKFHSLDPRHQEVIRMQIETLLELDLEKTK
jgi:transcriptional regulator with XRE-family HTH domain